MIRISTIACAALVATSACDKAADDEQKANKAVAVATDQVTAATQEADQKIARALGAECTPAATPSPPTTDRSRPRRPRRGTRRARASTTS